jgi:hypothetical protein
MPEEQAQAQQQLNCLNEGVQYHNEKASLWKSMNEIAKTCSNETGIDKRVITQVKDYLHYRGRGWGEDCLEKSEESEKYPDRVSPTFRRLAEIISNMYATGKESNLQVYLDAVKDRGITISIDTSKFTLPSNDVKEKVAAAIDLMDPIQCSICEKNDYMNDVLAVDAENTNLSPKDKYKKIVKLAASKQAGRDVDDKVQDEFVKVELFTNGLDAVNSIEQQ